MDFPMLVVVSTQDDRGEVQCVQKAANFGGATPAVYQFPDGSIKQVFAYVSPIHSPRATTGVVKFSTAGTPLMQGYVNVLYCDGSVRSAFVKQGEATDSHFFNTTKGPQQVLDNSTQNGSILTGTGATVEGTRFDPYQHQ
jgi:prepilin-type processing-associated H-X9-DG protein